MCKKVSSVFVLASLVISMVAMSSVSAQQATPAPTAAAAETDLIAPSASTEQLSIPGIGKVTGPVDGESKSITGDGATFPLPLYQSWIATYAKLTGVQVNYKGVGSGQGRKDFIAQAVDFGASDAPMSDSEIQKANAAGGDVVHIATTVGAIVPIYNIPELAGKAPLKFTGDNLAQIYLGKILKWNDPALVANNPDLANVNQTIITVFRSDGSGTTQNFTLYLSLVNQEWASTVKSGSTVRWPTQETNPPTGRADHNGVHDAVKDTPYSIGYVELAFAIGTEATGISAGMLQNAAGNWVSANKKSVTAAAEDITLPDDMRIVIIGKSTSPDAWPISTLTWLLVYTNQPDPSIGLALMRFLWWATHDGQAYSASLGYAPLPEAVIQKDEANILKIQINDKQAVPTIIGTPFAFLGGGYSGTIPITATK